MDVQWQPRSAGSSTFTSALPREMFQHLEHVETLKEITLKAGTIGSAAGAIFGFSADSHEATLIAVGVALLALLAVFHLSRLSVELATAEDKERRRKMAGAVRDIVRSELKAALGTDAQPRRAKLNQDERPPTMRRT
jgi:hypothetical protein